MAASMNEQPSGATGSSSLAKGERQVKSLSFDFCKFFHGHTRVSGWFSDRFGNPRRHFCGDFYGRYVDERLVLDEKLFYTDGIVESRVWEVIVSDSGEFTAESDSLLGGARGRIDGATLSMSYSMKVQVDHNKHWTLDMRDKMILQPDGSLHNITQVFKWGVRIGVVSAQYLHHDGDKLCSTFILNSAGDEKSGDSLSFVPDR